MFSLADGKLIPMKSDGTDGEPLQTKNSSLTIGTSVLSDWCVSESISDPTTRLAYEISKDNLGRVVISNKCGAQLLVNGESVLKKRPLLNNSQIEIPNNVRFRWIHSHDTAEARDSEFASWSDPGKKSKTKSRWAAEKARLTTHALHLLSSAQNDSSFNDSKNSGVHSFVDENDENDQFEETSKTDISIDACAFITPTKTKLSEDDRIKSVNDLILPNESYVLSMSQMMLTSYVASDNQKTPGIAHPKRESVSYSPSSPLQTPTSICSTPSSAAFQSIGQNEYSPNRSASFAIVKSPSTPTPGSRISKSMYLIDLTTPLTVASTNAVESKSCSRHLLKSAIKNATHKSGAKKINICISTDTVNKHVGTKSPKTPHVSGECSNVITSTPTSISSEEKSQKQHSEELILTGDTENAAQVEASPHVLFSNSKDEASQELIVNSSNISAMENLIGMAGGSQSNTVAPNNGSVENAQSEFATIEQEATVIYSNKSNRVSEITNLSAEEEDALLKIDGDTEENDVEFNEDFLLAGSTDEEDESKIDPAYDLNVPNTEPAKYQSVEECILNPSDIANLNELQQIAQISNNSISEAVDSIYNDLINDLDTSDSCNIGMGATTGGDESNYNETSAHDQEFSVLHASSSTESNDATEISQTYDLHNVTVEPTEETIVISSQEQPNLVDLCDNDSTFGNDSNAVQSHSQEYSPCMAANEDKSDVILESKSVANEWQRNDSPRDVDAISQSVDKMRNVQMHPIIADVTFENLNESSLNEERLLEKSETCNQCVITATTTSDANAKLNEIEKENSCDTNDGRISDLCGFGEEFSSEMNLIDHQKPATQKDCLDTVDNSLNDVDQIECERIEIVSEALQPSTTTVCALNTSHCSAILGASELGGLLSTLPDSTLNDHTNDNYSIGPTAVSDESTKVHSKESKNIFVKDANIDDHQAICTSENKYEDKGDQNFAATQIDAVSTATAAPINPVPIGHRLQQNSDQMCFPSDDEQKLNSLVAEGSAGDGTRNSNTQNNMYENGNDLNEKPKEHSEESDFFGQIEVASKVDSEVDIASEGSATINELNATDHIDTTQVDTNVSIEDKRVDREVGDDETSNASTKLRTVDEMYPELTCASNTAGIQNTDVKLNDAEIEHTEKDSTVINKLDVRRSGVQQRITTRGASEDIGTEEPSDKILIAFANLSADGEIQHKAAYESDDIQATVAENVAEQYPQDQFNVVVEIVKEIDVESKVTAADSEIASPLEDTVCDSDERIFETHNVFNNSAFANGSNSDGQPSLNQIDRGSIKSAVSITSDDVTSDRLSNESIQVTVAENNIDSNYTQHSESAEILEAIDAKSEDIAADPDNIETISVNNDHVDHAINQSLVEIANESVILNAADENKQTVSLTEDGSTIDGLVLQNQKNSEIVEQIDVESKHIETYAETDNADINELISTGIVGTDAADIPNLSGDGDSMGSEAIDEFDNNEISNRISLDSSVALKPSLDGQAAETEAEIYVPNQSENVIPHSEIRADIAESEAVIEIVDNDDDLEVIAIENESGIIDVSTTNTDANDSTDEHDCNAVITEHLQNVTPSEGFNSCTSRESNEESIESESEIIDSAKNGPSNESITRKETEPNTNEMEQSSVAKINNVKRSHSTVDDRKLEIVCVTGDIPTTMDIVSDSPTPTSNADQRIDIVSDKKAATIQFIDADHAQKQNEEISPISSKADEQALNANNENMIRTPRRKRLATEIIPVDASPRTPRQRQVPARFLESVFSMPNTKTPRSTKKSEDKQMKNVTNDNAEKAAAFLRHENNPKQDEIIEPNKKQTSQTNEEKTENVVKVDSNESRKLKRLRVAKAEEPAAFEPTPSVAITTEIVQSKTLRVLGKRGAAQRGLIDEDAPATDVEKPKRGRRQIKTTDDTAEKKEAEKADAEESKRSRRQVTSKTMDCAVPEEEKGDIAKLKRGRRQLPSKASKDIAAAKKPNEDEEIGGGSKDSMNKVDAVASEEISNPKPVRQRRRPVAEKVNKNEDEVKVAVMKVSTQSITDIESMDHKLPKMTRRKRNHSNDETTTSAGDANTKTFDRKDVNNAKDEVAEKKTANDATHKSIGSRKKAAASKPVETEEEGKKKPEQKLHTEKPLRTNQQAKANVEEPKVEDESEDVKPPSKKRVRRGMVDAPEATNPTNQPKRTIRGRPKKAESATIDIKDTSDTNANLQKTAKKVVCAEVLVEVRAKRGRAAKDITTPKPVVIASATTDVSNQKGEIKAHIAETVASVESVTIKKATRGRKKNQKEPVAIDENKPIEAVAETVETERHHENVAEKIVTVDSVPKQKLTRGRKKTQMEPVAIDGNEPIEAVSVEKQQETVPDAVDSAESAPKPKSTRSRKKNQQELVVIDENKAIEAFAVTEDVVLKPKSKKRVKAKDESLDELMLKRGKLHVEVETLPMKMEENQPKGRSSRQTPYANDKAMPSSSSTIRSTRSTRTTKK